MPTAGALRHGGIAFFHTSAVPPLVADGRRGRRDAGQKVDVVQDVVRQEDEAAGVIAHGAHTITTYNGRVTLRLGPSL